MAKKENKNPTSPKSVSELVDQSKQKIEKRKDEIQETEVAEYHPGLISEELISDGLSIISDLATSYIKESNETKRHEANTQLEGVKYETDSAERANKLTMIVKIIGVTVCIVSATILVLFDKLDSASSTILTAAITLILSNGGQDFMKKFGAGRNGGNK